MNQMFIYLKNKQVNKIQMNRCSCKEKHTKSKKGTIIMINKLN